MLESIAIKNIALIDEAFIEFSEGLNVLTGETGAGKSIVIDSLGFVLGEKASREIIRSGEKNARAEAVFSINDSRTEENIRACGIELDEKLVIITRTISESGKTAAKVNGQTVTSSMLRKITAELIDIHGQHEHQSLLSDSKQMEFLDGFCGEILSKKIEDFRATYKQFTDIQNEIFEIREKALDKENRLDFLEYRITELESACLKEGEDEALAEEKKLVSAADKLISCVESAVCLLYDGQNGAALDLVDSALHSIETTSKYDERLEDITERLAIVSREISEISQELRRYAEGIDVSPERIDEIEVRINEIYLIKKKYGTIAEALKSLDKMREERDLLRDSSFEIERLEKRLKEASEKVFMMCGDISEIRRKNAVKMEALITKALKDLSMPDAVFSVALTSAEPSRTGADKIEFMLSANKGETVRPLAKIASGGEMSRVMLAVKSISAALDAIETFIFDEIDQGISGRTAQKAAEKMAAIARSKQIICVTHLPQIAAISDKHMLIEKNIEGEKTLTRILELDEKSITDELGRLLGGVKITEHTINAAAEMRELAKQTKERI